MVLSSTAFPDSRRHGQLVSSSSRLPTGNSKGNLTSKKPSGLSGLRASDSTTQSHSVRRAGDAMDELAREINTFTIPRRRVLSVITPQASPRVPHRNRTGGPEKENVSVKVEETPLRQAKIRQSATSAKSPGPNAIPGSIKVKPVQFTSVSTDSKDAGLPRSSTTAKLSGRKPGSTLAPRAIVNSRSAFVLGPSIRKNCDITSSSQGRFSTQAEISAESTRFDSERKPAPVSSAEMEDTKSGMTLSKFCSYHSVPAVRDTPERPSAPGGSSDRATFCDTPRFELAESLELRTYSDSLLSSTQGMAPPITSSAEESGTGLNHIAFSPSFGSPSDSARDNKQASAESTSDYEHDSFELVSLHDEPKRSCQAGEGDEGASQTSMSIVTANAGDISGKALSTTISHTVVEDATDTRDFEEKETKNTNSGTVLGVLGEREHDMNEDKANFNNKDVTEDVVSHTAKAVVGELDDNDKDEPAAVAAEPSSPAPQSPRPSASIPPTPPSTPVGNASASATVASVPPLPPSLFPRLFSELASTYAHLGFGSRPASPLKNIAGPQAERTRQELASLRAGLGGSVLARARVFGSTIWNTKSICAMEPYSSSSSSSSAQPKALEMGMAKPTDIRGSDSNSDCMETPPASPSPASVSAWTSSVTPALAPDEGSELKETRMMMAAKRTLGCADAMRAVAMAQQLWKTKNFVADLK